LFRVEKKEEKKPSSTPSTIIAKKQESKPIPNKPETKPIPNKSESKPVAKQKDELSLIFTFFGENNNKFPILPLVLNTQIIIINTLIILLLISFS
jgi:hypothetical protein